MRAGRKKTGKEKNNVCAQRGDSSLSRGAVVLRCRYRTGERDADNTIHSLLGNVGKARPVNQKQGQTSIRGSSEILYHELSTSHPFSALPWIANQSANIDLSFQHECTVISLSGAQEHRKLEPRPSQAGKKHEPSLHSCRKQDCVEINGMEAGISRL